ncbi:hypothetical protein B0A55_11140, partial [Friedmanniomyces simplex]
MPKLQARNDVRPDPSNVYALKEMLQSLEEDVDKDEARYRTLKSTMEWDSDDDDEAEEPGLPQLGSTSHIAATDVATKSDDTPFPNSLVPYKPLPRTPETRTTTSLQESFDSDLRTYDMAQEFMQQYPPPPDPDTPTRSAGRSLRHAKSQCSVRTSVIGARLAPQIAPPKRTAKVEIINPDDSPGVYIARAATAAGLPSSPLHPDWEAAIETVKTGLAKELKEAGRKAREDEKSQKLTAKDNKSVEQQVWKQHGDRIMSPASSFDSAPSVDYAAVTDEDLQAFAWALQREIEQGASTGVVRRLFRNVSEQKAKEKENVIRQAVLAKQKRLVDREMEARAECRRIAERQQAATHTGTPKQQLVKSSCNKKLDGQISRMEKERATTGLALI